MKNIEKIASEILTAAMSDKTWDDFLEYVTTTHLKPQDFKYLEYVIAPSYIVIRDIDGNLGHFAERVSDKKIAEWTFPNRLKGKTTKDLVHYLKSMGAKESNKRNAAAKVYYATFEDVGKGQQFMKHLQGYAQKVYGNKVQGQLEVHIEVEPAQKEDIKRLIGKYDGILRSDSGKRISAEKIAQQILFNLKREVGVTRVSLDNLKKILSKGYKLSKAEFIFKRSDEAVLHAEFINKDDEIFTWDFTGFSAGYGGEGPRGLAEALKMLGIRSWDMNTIVDLKPGNYKVAAFGRPSIMGPKTIDNVIKYIKVKKKWRLVYKLMNKANLYTSFTYF